LVLLDHTLTAIEQAPETGGDNFPPYRYAKAGKHYIFYKIERESVSVSRILHGSMDFIRHLKEIT
jgi:plasmid stabilization system protein ParE